MTRLILTYDPVPPCDVRQSVWGVLILPALFVIGAGFAAVMP